MSLPDSNTSDTPDYDIDVQPQDLSRRIQHLSNVMNHFWKRWRNEYLIELQNAHRYLNQNTLPELILSELYLLEM